MIVIYLAFLSPIEMRSCASAYPKNNDKKQVLVVKYKAKWNHTDYLLAILTFMICFL